MHTSAELLGPDGPFAKILEGFRLRQQQIEMAGCIQRLIDQENGVLIVESPTGTGKTLAYLTACINSQKTAIISTATRHLQDQIFYKDLPLVLDALNVSKDTCLLKGRNNYLCLHRLHTHAAIEVNKQANLSKLYTAICDWSEKTLTGDVNDIEQFDENSRLRPLITSTSDNCLGAECAHFDQCFVRQTRKNAMNADIVVVNHYLYLANLLLQEDGFGQLLPDTDVLIFDEAHTLPDIASMQLSRSVSSRQIAKLIGDLNTKLTVESNTVDDVYESMQRLDIQLMKVVRSFNQPLKQPIQQLLDDSKLMGDFKCLLEDIENLSLRLKLLADDKEFNLLYQRALRMATLLGECIFQEHEKDTFFCWVDASAMRFVLHQTPIDLHEFGGRLSSPQGPITILVSATLSSAGNFSYFSNQLALSEAQSKSFSSPFDYAKQCKLYIPEALPDPRSAEFTDALIKQALKLIKACGGRTFFLFTSHQAMERVFTQLSEQITFPILKQGQHPKHELVDRFSRLGNAVLLGTSSFWEGVDVKGPSLSCVIIDKLPFSSPDNPVLKARLQRIEQSGQNPFMHYQLPQMIISLKQGIGRLIRDEGDKGIIMIADSRLTTKSYGAKVLAALPAIPQTSDWDEINSFAKSL